VPEPAAVPSEGAPLVRKVPFREADIDLGLLAHNVSRYRQLHGGVLRSVDVGAQAWGHGVDVVVPALLRLGVRAFVVARLDEAERVRAVAPDAIIVTTQHAASETFERAAALEVAPALRSRAEFDRAMIAGVRRVVLVADDGVGLPAFEPDDREAAVADAGRCGVTVLTTELLDVAGPELFGVSESDIDTAPDFRPVLRLWAPVVATKRVGGDEGVSYGYTYRTSAETTLALVPLGYADGLARAGSNRMPASLAGVTRTVAGRVAMDAFVLDMGDGPAPALGTPVSVLGDSERGEPTALQHARALGTVSAEVTTRLSARPYRRAVELA
jgi:alanine racemase